MDEEWLTYQQAGDRLGISAEAAGQRSQRLHWRHQRGNDGCMLILVPLDAYPDRLGQQPEQTLLQTGVERPLTNRTASDGPNELPAGLVEPLREQLARAEARADAANAERVQAAKTETARRGRLLDLLESMRADISEHVARAVEADRRAAEAREQTAAAVARANTAEREASDLRQLLAAALAKPPPSRRGLLARLFGK